ncbi:ABC transporter permease [Atopomonas sediminilitoris]|uniref:ABC transporter permease n=1 Tax=Atopomonas sediminilitoris TaxID=2919919 RepID=UPI001F4E6FF2|nr:ABC transporter permease subunit [Atopomonas sediminilitoris]MCJ8169866.1 ABC transporter permease subunit [Atopomonas sediminilitoris]
MFGLFQLAPLAWVAVNSLLVDGQWSLGHFREALGSPFMRQALGNSLWVSALSSVLGLIIAALSSYALYRSSSRLRELVLAFASMTSNFSGVPLAFAFIILLGFNGSLSLLLRQWGLGDDFNLYSTQGLLLIYTYFQIPLGVLLLYPAFDALRDDWQEAAALLGASPWVFWRDIGLPVLWPAIAGTLLILLANAMGAYATAYALTSGNLNLLTIRIASLVAGDIYLEPQLASALAMLLVGMLVLTAVVNQCLLQRSRYAPD